MLSNVLMLVSIDLIAIIGEMIILSNSSRNNKDVGQPLFNLLVLSLLFVTFTDLISWFCMDVDTTLGVFIGSFAGF